jgi:hypothetical protein
MNGARQSFSWTEFLARVLPRQSEASAALARRQSRPTGSSLESASMARSPDLAPPCSGAAASLFPHATPELVERAARLFGGAA